MPDGALAALREQLDLREIEINPGVALFQTDASWPLRSDVSDLDLPDGGVPTLAEQLPLGFSPPPAVLGTDPGTKFSGDLAAQQAIAQSVTADPGWVLDVEGDRATRSDLFGWSQQFETPAAGTATLAWSTPWSTRALQAVQLLGLVALLVIATRRRRLVPSTRRRRRGRAAEPVVVVGPEGLLADETTAETAAEAAEDRSDPGPGSDPVLRDPQDPLLSDPRDPA